MNIKYIFLLLNAILLFFLLFESGGFYIILIIPHLIATALGYFFGFCIPIKNAFLRFVFIPVMQSPLFLMLLFFQQSLFLKNRSWEDALNSILTPYLLFTSIIMAFISFAAAVSSISHST